MALGVLKFVRDLADWTNMTMPAQHKSFMFFSQGVGGLGAAGQPSGDVIRSEMLAGCSLKVSSMWIRRNVSRF